MVAESRRRIQNNQNRARRGRADRSEKEKPVKAEKEKQIKEKPVKEKSAREKAKTEKIRTEKIKSEKTGDGNNVSVLDKLKALWNKWLETYHKNTMQILFGTLTCLAVLLVVAIVATYPYEQDDKQSTTEQQTTAPQEETTAPNEEQTTETTEPEIIPETEDSAIHNLVVAYIDAVYVNPSEEAVALVLDDVTNFDLEKKSAFYSKYAETFENIKCYKFETTVIDNAYTVYVEYDVKLNNIETVVPTQEIMVVKFDTVAGQFFIHNLTEAEILDFKLSSDSGMKYIAEMNNEREKLLEAALASDAELKEVYDLMNNISSQATQTTDETSSSAEETTTAAPQ